MTGLQTLAYLSVKIKTPIYSYRSGRKLQVPPAQVVRCQASHGRITEVIKHKCLKSNVGTYLSWWFLLLLGAFPATWLREYMNRSTMTPTWFHMTETYLFSFINVGLIITRCVLIITRIEMIFIGVDVVRDAKEVVHDPRDHVCRAVVARCK